MLVYEWASTFLDEVNFFWNQKKTLATGLFLLNRYAPIIYILSSFSGASATTDKVSNASIYVCHNHQHSLLP